MPKNEFPPSNGIPTQELHLNPQGQQQTEIPQQRTRCPLKLFAYVGERVRQHKIRQNARRVEAKMQAENNAQTMFLEAWRAQNNVDTTQVPVDSQPDIRPYNEET